jgi:hypothetical protein
VRHASYDAVKAPHPGESSVISYNFAARKNIHMTVYQLISAATSMGAALDIVRDEIISAISDRVALRGGYIKTPIQPCQFILGRPYEVKGVQINIDDSSETTVILLDGYEPVPVEEASTPVLTAILSYIS